METSEILSSLESLIRLDVDACHAYDQAIKNVSEPLVKDKLILFRQDHQRHVDLLSEKMRELGGIPPVQSPDFKGFFITGFTALVSLAGTKASLAAMETNELLTNSRYEAASKLNLPFDIAAIVNSNWEDEKRHLRFIKEAL